MGLIWWFYVVFTIFWMLAVIATKRQGNTASETLAAGRVQLWVTAPQKQSWLLLHKSKRITSGGTGQPTASQMSSRPSNIFSSNRVGIKLTELGCMQSCSMHCIKKKEPNDFANVFHLSLSSPPSGNFPLEFQDEALLVCTWSAWNGLPLANIPHRCGQVSFPGWEGKYGSILPLLQRWGWEGRGLIHVVSRHHLLVVGMGSNRSARTLR